MGVGSTTHTECHHATDVHIMIVGLLQLQTQRTPLPGDRLAEVAPVAPDGLRGDEFIATLVWPPPPARLYIPFGSFPFLHPPKEGKTGVPLPSGEFPSGRRKEVFLRPSGMTFRLEERKETKEFLWREWFDTHHWSFEAHLRLHVELALSQVETT